MKIGLLLFFNFLLLNSCTMSYSKYKPQDYFDGRDLSIAEAIYYNNSSMLKDYLKQPDRDINKLGKAGITFLLYALKVREKGMAELLLKNGADPNVLCPEIPKPEWRVAPDDTVHLFLPLEYVCRNFFAFNDIGYAKLLLQYGANINDTRSTPPLIAAAVSGANRKKIIEFLLDNKANINIQDKLTQTTVLIDVSQTGDFDLVNYLLNRGADWKIKDISGSTLGWQIQKEINRKVGTEERKQKVNELKTRLEKLGVVFPVKLEKPLPKLEDAKKDTTEKTVISENIQKPIGTSWSTLFDD